MKRREIEFIVEPMSDQEIALLSPKHWRENDQGLFVYNPQPIVASRRSFLKSTAAFSLFGAFVGIGSLSSACDAESLRALFQAVEVLKNLFRIVEGVAGNGVFSNNGDKEQTIEILYDLNQLDDAGEVKYTTDKVKGEATIPTGGRPQKVSFNNMEAKEPAKHNVKGQAVGQERRSVDFIVTEA